MTDITTDQLTTIVALEASLGLAIPPAIAQRLGLQAGMHVVFTPTANGFSVTTRPTLDPGFHQPLAPSTTDQPGPLEILRRSEESLAD